MKETQKQEIERLKRELLNQKNLYNKLNSEMLEMQSKADKEFSNSGEYTQMNKRIEFLETQNKLLESKNTNLNEKNQKLINKLINELKNKNNTSDVQKIIIEKKYNERGAGRKTRFTDQEKETIKMYRLQGKTIKELAEMFCCSVGLIHKLISEQD